MVFWPCAFVALRSDLLVTLDCLDVDVSPACPLRAGQSQPTRNKPSTPSLWNPEMSARAMRQGGSFGSQSSASPCPAPLYSATFAWICCLLSVHRHSSHPLCNSLRAIIDLEGLETCLYLNVFLHVLMQILSDPLMPAAVSITAYAQGKASQHQETFLLRWVQWDAQSLIQGALFCVPSICVTSDD